VEKRVGKSSWRISVCFKEQEEEYECDIRERAVVPTSADFLQPCEERGKPRLNSTKQDTRPRQQNARQERKPFEFRSFPFFFGRSRNQSKSS
jgi:hypothetical protein